MLHGMGEPIQGALVGRGPAPEGLHALTAHAAGHGVPGAPVARKHIERIVLEGQFLRRRASRRTAAQPGGGGINAACATGLERSRNSRIRSLETPFRKRAPDRFLSRGEPPAMRQALEKVRRPAWTADAPGHRRSRDRNPRTAGVARPRRCVPGRGTRRVGPVSSTRIRRSRRPARPPRMGRDPRLQTCGNLASCSRDPPRPQARTRRLGGLRVRQALARGRRRRRRGDRLLRVLRPGDDPPRPGPASRRAGRDQRPSIHPPRNRRGDSPLELPPGDPLRHDRRRARGRQHRHPQTRRAVARHGLAPVPGAPGGRSTPGRAELPARHRRGSRRGAGRRSPDRSHRVHRLEGRRPGHQPDRQQHQTRSKPRQARDRRDGRQERYHHRRRRRPRRGGRGRPPERLRLCRPEVLGLLAGHRAGRGL